MKKINNIVLVGKEAIIFKFVVKTKKDRNWIQSDIRIAWLKGKIKSFCSKKEVESSLRRFARLGIIKTEFWNERRMRVYWK